MSERAKKIVGIGLKLLIDRPSADDSNRPNCESFDRPRPNENEARSPKTDNGSTDNQQASGSGTSTANINKGLELGLTDVDDVLMLPLSNDTECPDDVMLPYIVYTQKECSIVYEGMVDVFNEADSTLGDKESGDITDIDLTDNAIGNANVDSIDDNDVSNMDDNVLMSAPTFKSRTMKESRKRKRQLGLEYINSAQNLVSARSIKPLKMCRSKCQERLPEPTRETIFEEYWKIGDHDRRKSYAASLISVVPTKTHRPRTDEEDKKRYRNTTYQYSFKVNGEPKSVCKVCFLATLGESRKFIEHTMTSVGSNAASIVDTDARGTIAPKSKHSDETLDAVNKHLDSFPFYESHYTRRDNSKKFLASDLTLTKMFEMYKETCDVNSTKPVSRKYYERNFHKKKLSFKKPKVDTCHKCDTLQMQIKISKDAAELEKLKVEQNAHLAEADKAYEAKKLDKETAKNDSSKQTFTFDLEQCLPTPYLNSSVAFYKRQLWTFNLTIHNCTNSASTCYMWHEGIGGRGANQIGSCLYEHLMALPDEVTHVTLYSDTCAGQNKNSHVAAMMIVLLQKKHTIQVIDHKFLVPGHTHMECDIDHAAIEKAKKKYNSPISHPYDWYQLVRSVKRKQPFTVVEMNHEMFLQFSDLFKGPLVNRLTTGFKWRDAKWLRYTPGNVSFQYKDSLEDGPFKTFSFKRRGQTGANLDPPKSYNGPIPIPLEKKKDLLDLLPLVHPTFHEFYRNLKTSQHPATDPDLNDSDDE